MVDLQAFAARARRAREADDAARARTTRRCAASSATSRPSSTRCGRCSSSRSREAARDRRAGRRRLGREALLHRAVRSASTELGAARARPRARSSRADVGGPADRRHLLQRRCSRSRSRSRRARSQIQRNIIAERILGLPKEPLTDGLPAERGPGALPAGRARASATARLPTRGAARAREARRLRPRRSGASSPRWACSRCACPRARAASGSAAPRRCSSSRSSAGASCRARSCGPTSPRASCRARPRARRWSAGSTSSRVAGADPGRAPRRRSTRCSC